MIHFFFPIYNEGLSVKRTLINLCNPFNIYRFLKYSYQRLTRGFDDTATWNIDYHLATQIPAMIKVMKSRKIGYPEGLSEIEWANILENICIGFDAYAELDDVYDIETIKLETEKFEEGFVLFHKYYSYLWD